MGALICVAGLAGCASEGTPEDVVAMYEAREHSVSRVAVERSLTDLLPNRRFAVDGAAASALTEGMVVGTITDVTPGRAYVVEGSDAPSGAAVEFDSKDALWRTLDVSLEVETGLGSSLADVTELRFGLPVSGTESADEISAGLMKMGRVLVVLDEQGGFEYDRDLYRVHWDGVFLTPVGSDGTFTFSALGESADAFHDGVDTLTELDAEASRDGLAFATDELGNERVTVSR